MKALRWHGREDLRLEDIPEPSPGPGLLKVKVGLAGICGTDLKEYAAGPCLVNPEKAPLTMGHEFAGTVAAVGEGVTGFAAGDRVSGVGYWYCGDCYYCKKGNYNLCVNSNFSGLDIDGCMAEYYVTPAYACYRLPDSVSDEAGALVEPLAVALHAVSQGKVKPGDTVAVVGDGAIGLCSLLAARAAGAAGVYLVAKHRGRGELAVQMGADGVIYLDDGSPAERLKELTGGPGADAAIECVGKPDTPLLAAGLLRRGGAAVIAGVFEQPGTFDFSAITFTEVTMVGSSIYVDEGRTAVELIANGSIDPTPVITSRVTLENAVEKGFRALLHDKEAHIKVLLQLP